MSFESYYHTLRIMLDNKKYKNKEMKMLGVVSE
jgi:hypothetical protein